MKKVLKQKLFTPGGGNARRAEGAVPRPRPAPGPRYLLQAPAPAAQPAGAVVQELPLPIQEDWRGLQGLLPLCIRAVQCILLELLPDQKTRPPLLNHLVYHVSCRKHVLVFKWPPNHKILSTNFPRQFICKREMKSSNTTISSAPRRVRSQTNTQSTPQLCLLFWWARVRGSCRAHISRFCMAWQMENTDVDTERREKYKNILKACL